MDAATPTDRREEGRRRLEAYMERHRRSVQLKELAILREVDALCRRRGIPYWLDGGTLLGAVRHKGFIPWDDDIDIAMRLSDARRFVAAAREELSPNLFMQTPRTDPAVKFPILKVRDLDSLIVEHGDDFRLPYAKGLYVDIFPMVDYPSVPPGFVRRVARGFCRANAILHERHCYSWRSVAELFYFGGKRAVCRLLWNAARLIASRGEYLSNTLDNNGYGIMHRTDSVFPLSSVEFEGLSFSAPADPDAYLRDLYGDYMTLPPAEKRHGHAAFYRASLS